MIALDVDAGDAALVIRGNGDLATYFADQTGEMDALASLPVSLITLCAYLLTDKRQETYDMVVRLQHLMTVDGMDA